MLIQKSDHIIYTNTVFCDILTTIKFVKKILKKKFKNFQIFTFSIPAQWQAGSARTAAVHAVLTDAAPRGRADQQQAADHRPRDPAAWDAQRGRWIHEVKHRAQYRHHCAGARGKLTLIFLMCNEKNSSGFNLADE